MARPSWQVVGASVRGAAHLRSGLPNQDAIGWSPDPAGTSPLVIAVSDGHGSNRCFRSDAGAAMAVRIALAIMAEFDQTLSPQAAEQTARELITRNLVTGWREAVQADLAQRPLADPELNSLQERDGAAARQSVERNPIVAYGATLLTVLVAESFVLYLQLGDGDIMTVSESGEVNRPLPKDERLLGNETTSLCLPEAWRDFRVSMHPLERGIPALIVLSTDGYANSFRDEAGFLQVGSDLLRLIRSDGLSCVSSNLASWLQETSQAGSGDDITVGIVCRGDLCVPKTPDDSHAGESADGR
jgi:serine/threonine protein phosphatase PrpC